MVFHFYLLHLLKIHSFTLINKPTITKNELVVIF